MVDAVMLPQVGTGVGIATGKLQNIYIYSIKRRPVVRLDELWSGSTSALNLVRQGNQEWDDWMSTGGWENPLGEH